MKKLFSLFLAAIMVLSLAACGNKAANEPNGSSQSNQSTQDGSDTLDYPSAPITLYCPWAAGGSADMMSRGIANLASKHFDGANVNVINRAGGNGGVALSEINTSSGKNDGYTWSFASDATLSISPYTTEVSYKTDDFTIVGAVAAEYVGLFTRGDSQFNTLQDVVDYYTSTGETLLHGQAGTYGRNHLTSIALFQNMGVKEEVVAYGGASEAIAALLGGEVEFVVIAPGQALPYMESGDMKGIAMISDGRPEAFADIPTVAEQGYGDLSAVSVRIVIVPADTDPEIVAYLRKGFASLVQDPEWKELLASNGIMEAQWTAEDLQAHLPNETLMLWDVIEDLDLLVEGSVKPEA